MKEKDLLTINSTDIPSYNPLPLFGGVVVRQGRQDEMPSFVLLKSYIFGLLHICWNLSLIIWLQLLNSELPHSPFFEIFVSPIPPAIAGLGKRVPNIWRTLDTRDALRKTPVVEMNEQTGKTEPHFHQNMRPDIS